MQTVMFKRQFIALIRSGEKVQTLRLSFRPRVNVGDEVRACAGRGTRAFAILVVDDVRAVPMRDLTVDDARADGFADLDALKVAWNRIYRRAPWDDNRVVYVMRFHTRAFRDYVVSQRATP